jgi:molybdenum cofactor biosynthesis enzyme
MLRKKMGEIEIELTQIDENGSVRMDDIADKQNTKRGATA